ncbi:TlpA family protein disulfide reductase [Salipaludibacillus sp. LMS25]|jgi:peroxiredoxin|uniref:TlpA family protein disulfide reductase n=1 Tax=Salipaludibacillus sp. LMS25 TaxID=2924031 RepID=UPI0020D030E4|nr:TlpA disulfide reductase family protein [Salipaludibacillus sp. LMS25]UTR16616.1 TlpA family protein disulfide reductase [Salipaludibacillus sp. LMS25]
MRKVKWGQGLAGLFVIGLLIVFVVGLKVQGDTVGVGDKAYDFVLRGYDDVPYQLSDFQGQIVILNFFSTWCKPCESQAPDMLDLSKEYGDDVVVITIVKAESKRAVNRFIDRTGYEDKLYLFDFDLNVSERYGITGQPETVIIDKGGIIADHISGSVTKEFIVDQITDLH